ncbi:hypothetical protein [Methylocystis sp. B8]|uniref:hypothetical protein n=1 Tax=Methylocystis sp. B8 TaxID=544938 RepID=UPI0010FD8CDF|nr:hypothetical protein [Methylocystis sp. B8]TLG71199.1 hypothetical protein FEV16_16550 [Methylocystis sp. B8]
MKTLVKTTEDGRKLEVIGFAIYLDGKLEAVDLTEVNQHPLKWKILSVMPDATHVAGHVALTREETEIAVKALKEAQEKMLADPVAIAERFRIAAMWKAREQGIE